MTGLEAHGPCDSSANLAVKKRFEYFYNSNLNTVTGLLKMSVNETSNNNIRHLNKQFGLAMGVLWST